jgi:glycosyltransferase involved in cell wall biosynthesis
MSTTEPGRDRTPLRVTYVINALGTGGAEHSLAELLAHDFGGELAADVICLRHNTQGVEQRVVAELGVPVRWLRPGTMVRQARELRALLAADPPDVVVSSVYQADIVTRLARLGRPRWRLISTLVNSQYDAVRVAADPNVSRLGMMGTQVIDAVTGRLAVDRYIALTQAVADHATKRLRVPPRRISVVPRGRSRRRLGEPGPKRRAEGRARFGIDPDRPVVLTVGRREYQKGQRHLLEAMPAILDACPDALLVVAGRDGNAAAELDAIVERLGIGDAVQFLGHQTDVPGVLALADVFAFPSLWEGFGGALVEALAMGLPVVASALPELVEVLGHGSEPTGVTVPVADPAALAAAVTALLADPERRARLGAAGRRRFEDAFDIDRVAEATLAVYRQVAAS